MRRKICWWLKCKGCWFRWWWVGEVREVFLHDDWMLPEPSSGAASARNQESYIEGLEPAGNPYITTACNDYRSLTWIHQECGSGITQQRRQRHPNVVKLIYISESWTLLLDGFMTFNVQILKEAFGRQSWDPNTFASSGFKAHPSCRDACSGRHAQAGCGAARALSMDQSGTQ